jgi:hypothetical protein
VKQGLAFVALATLMILGGAWGITTLRPEPEIVRAVWASAVLALGVQVVGFLIARSFAKTNPIAGWGIGALLRMFTLLIYAVVGTKALGLESVPALLSLVGFLFVTMLVEPLFLKQ